jgi:hypothetical protein
LASLHWLGGSQFGWGWPASDCADPNRIGWILIVSGGLTFVVAIIGAIAPALHHFGMMRHKRLVAISIVLVGVTFVGCAAWYFWPTNSGLVTGPIEWTFHDGASPVAFSAAVGEPLWADAFQFSGQNKTDEPISIVKAFVRSDITLRELALQFTGGPGGSLLPAEGSEIISHGRFHLVAFIPPNDPKRTEGILAEKFRVDFHRFTFILQYDGDKFIKQHYSADEVDKLISIGEAVNREALKDALPQSSVVRPNP